MPTAENDDSGTAKQYSEMRGASLIGNNRIGMRQYCRELGK